MTKKNTKVRTYNANYIRQQLLLKTQISKAIFKAYEHLEALKYLAGSKGGCAQNHPYT